MTQLAFGRRRALAIIGGLAVALLFWSRRMTAGFRAVRHRPLAPDTRPLDPDVARPVSLLTGALFGHQLDEREVAEIGRGLEQLVALDGGWRLEFSRAALWLDRRARAHGAPRFGDATADARYAIVDELMRAPVETWSSSALATIDTDVRTRRRMRSELVEALATMYIGSATSWRRRGYARRPGDPGDPREYTRAGGVAKC